jgi:hypothetical protein
VIDINDLVGKPVPFKVRYPKKKPIVVVGFGDAGLAPLCSGARNTTAVFKGGGWLWLPDLLKHYDLVEE